MPLSPKEIERRAIQRRTSLMTLQQASLKRRPPEHSLLVRGPCRASNSATAGGLDQANRLRAADETSTGR